LKLSPLAILTNPTDISTDADCCKCSNTCELNETPTITDKCKCCSDLYEIDLIANTCLNPGTTTPLGVPLPSLTVGNGCCECKDQCSDDSDPTPWPECKCEIETVKCSDGVNEPTSDGKCCSDKIDQLFWMNESCDADNKGKYTGVWPDCCTCNPDFQCPNGSKPPTGAVYPNCCCDVPTRFLCGGVNDNGEQAPPPDCDKCQCKDKVCPGLEPRHPTEWKPFNMGCKCCSPNYDCQFGTLTLDYPECCTCYANCPDGETVPYGRNCKCCTDTPEGTKEKCGANSILTGQYPYCKCKCSNTCSNNQPPSEWLPNDAGCKCCNDVTICGTNGELTGIPPLCCKCNRGDCNSGQAPSTWPECQCCEDNLQCEDTGVAYQYRDTCKCKCKVERCPDGHSPSPYPECKCCDATTTECGTNGVAYGYYPYGCKCKCKDERCPNGVDRPSDWPGCECCENTTNTVDCGTNGVQILTGNYPNCCKCNIEICPNGEKPSRWPFCKCCENYCGPNGVAKHWPRCRCECKDDSCPNGGVVSRPPACDCKCKNTCRRGANFIEGTCCCECQRCPDGEIPSDPPACTCKCNNVCQMYGVPLPYIPNTCFCKRRCEKCPNGRRPRNFPECTCDCPVPCPSGESFVPNTCCCSSNRLRYLEDEKK